MLPSLTSVAAPMLTMTATLISTTALPSSTSVLDQAPSDDSKDKVQNWSSFIGIVTAIVGNVLIALALNVQRYAHTRLHRRRRERDRRRALFGGNGASGTGQYDGRGSSRPGSYDAAAFEDPDGVIPRRARGSIAIDHDDDDGHDTRDTEPLAGSFSSDASGEPKGEGTTTYLKDPYWWLGQVLITVGEMGNFLAYGFAPASIVSPLGVVALISNCVIAPIVFKEVFRKRDFYGVVIAIGGAMTIVLSANQEETKLDPHDVWAAITTMEFKIYMAVTCSLIVLLMFLSPRYGKRTILIDLGLVGLFGGYTVLSTKGVSSMLSSTLLGAFTTPVTYPLLAVLLGTAIMQVRYVNKALQRFDSTQVIPIQFVTFTLCVIIGSAVLYRDFEHTTDEQAIKFIGGCFFTFFGVFLITNGRPPTDDDDEDLLDDIDGVDENIGLVRQDHMPPSTPRSHSRRTSDSTRHRRSSRVSFHDIPRKSRDVINSGVPSLRVSAASIPHLPRDSAEDSPLLENPWTTGPEATAQHPGPGRHTISTESVNTIASVAVTDGTSHPTTPNGSHEPQLGFAAPRSTPATPRASMSSSRPASHHFGGGMYSPSPFSSTVSAVVADKLLSHLESPAPRRLSLQRSRPSLRSSLFVPQDELSDDEAARDVRTNRDRGEAFSLLPEVNEGDADEAKQGVRGRARSLSLTLGQFLGVRPKSRRKDGDGTAED